MTIDLTLNGKPQSLKSDPSTPLLWVLRDELNLTGTKFGCGIMQCGACSVLVDGAATRSCLLPVGSIAGKSVTTIEQVDQSALGATAKRVQAAWVKHQVPQCGYCQSGFVIAVTALLHKTPKPTASQIDEALSNVCRCGTYDAMRAAIAELTGSPA